MGFSLVVFAGVVFAGIEWDFLGSTPIYDLVNVYITMENHNAFHGKTHVIFYGHSQYLCWFTRGYVYKYQFIEPLTNIV